MLGLHSQDATFSTIIMASHERVGDLCVVCFCRLLIYLVRVIHILCLRFIYIIEFICIYLQGQNEGFSCMAGKGKDLFLNQTDAGRLIFAALLEFASRTGLNKEQNPILS